MIYKILGKTGLQVSALSLGSWLTYGQSVGDDITEECMTLAYDAGINYFDGAEAYGAGAAELAMGRVFKKKGWGRDTLILAGKVHPRAGGRMPSQKGLTRKHILDCTNMTLKRFGTDYIDMMYCHRPDSSTPVEETVLAMNDMIKQGKILYWGTSEFSISELVRMHNFANDNGLIGPTMEQTEYNLMEKQRVEKDFIPLYDNYSMSAIAYCPLAGGILTGKYNDGVEEGTRVATNGFVANKYTDEVVTKLRAFDVLCKEAGMTMIELSLAYIMHNKNVTSAILGASKPHYIPMNLKSVDHVEKIDDDLLARINEIF